MKRHEKSKAAAEKRDARNEAQNAPAPSTDMGSLGIRKYIDDGYTPYVGEEEARTILLRLIDAKPAYDDYKLLEGIEAGLRNSPMRVSADLQAAFAKAWGALSSLERVVNEAHPVYSEDISELYTEWQLSVFEPMILRWNAEQAKHAATPAPPTPEETARDLIQSIHGIIAVLSGQRAFQKQSGAPKQSAIARELFRRGFDAEQIMQAGFGRGTTFDARQVCRAEILKSGQPLPPNLEIKPGSARRGGDDKRTGTGDVANENREASRLVAMVAPVLMKPSRRSMRDGKNKIEAIPSQSLRGSYDLGQTNFTDNGETDDA